jgi:hypothetical protein
MERRATRRCPPLAVLGHIHIGMQLIRRSAAGPSSGASMSDGASFCGSCPYTSSESFADRLRALRSRGRKTEEELNGRMGGQGRGLPGSPELLWSDYLPMTRLVGFSVQRCDGRRTYVSRSVDGPLFAMVRRGIEVDDGAAHPHEGSVCAPGFGSISRWETAST